MMHKMEMVSTKRTKKDIENDENPKKALASHDLYPYGMTFSLENDIIEKLGIDIESLSLGRKFMGEVMMEVKSMNKEINERRGNKSITMQITEMGVHDMGPSKKLKDVMKKKKEEEY